MWLQFSLLEINNVFSLIEYFYCSASFYKINTTLFVYVLKFHEIFWLKDYIFKNSYMAHCLDVVNCFLSQRIFLLVKHKISLFIIFLRLSFMNFQLEYWEQLLTKNKHLFSTLAKYTTYQTKLFVKYMLLNKQFQ